MQLVCQYMHKQTNTDMDRDKVKKGERERQREGERERESQRKKERKREGVLRGRGRDRASACGQAYEFLGHAEKASVLDAAGPGIVPLIAVHVNLRRHSAAAGDGLWSRSKSSGNQ